MLSSPSLPPTVPLTISQWSDKRLEELLSLDADEYHYHPSTLSFLRGLLNPLEARLLTEPDLHDWSRNEAPDLLNQVARPVTVEKVVAELLICIGEGLHVWMVRGPYGTTLPPDIPIDAVITPWDLLNSIERYTTLNPNLIPRRYWESVLEEEPRSFVRLRPQDPCLRIPVTISDVTEHRVKLLNYDELAGIIVFSKEAKALIEITVAGVPFSVEKMEEWRYSVTDDDVLFDYYQYSFYRSGPLALSPSRGFRRGLELAAALTEIDLNKVLEEEKQVRWDKKKEKFIEKVL